MRPKMGACLGFGSINYGDMKSPTSKYHRIVSLEVVHEKMNRIFICLQGATFNKSIQPTAEAAADRIVRPK